MSKKRKAQQIGSNIHNEVNQIRQAKGLNELKGDAKLVEQAKEYAREMAKQDELGHHVDGKSPQSRYNGSGNSENVLYTYDKGSTSKTASEAVTQWMNSLGHRKNILRKSSSYDGVGVWFRGNKVYVAHAFANRRVRIPNFSLGVNLTRRLKNVYRTTYSLAGRALETPYAPIRALDPSWWRILPRRRQRNLTIGLIFGGLGMWIMLATDLPARLPTNLIVNGIRLPLFWILVLLVIIGEIVRYRR
jgi:hypothetical protein